MKALQKTIAVCTAFMTAAAILPSAVSLASAEENLYPSTMSEYNTLLENYPEHYRVYEDSVYFMWMNSDYIVSTHCEFDAERNTYGYIFKPAKDGRYVITALESCEEIIDFTLFEENDSHIHFFYPYIRNYTVTVENGLISVEKDGEKDFSTCTDVNAYIQEKTNEMRSYADQTGNEILTVCEDYTDVTIEDVLDEEYYAYVNGNSTEHYYFTYIDREYGDDISQFCITTAYDEKDNITVSDTGVAEIALRSTCAGWMDGNLEVGTDDIWNFYIITPKNDGITEVSASDINNTAVYTLTVKDGRFVPFVIVNDAGEPIPGDLTLDNEVSMADAAILQKYMMNQRSLTNAQKFEADVNGDGRINIIDMALLKKILREQGLTSELTPVTRMDTTKAATWQGWNAAMMDLTYVITSREELEKIVAPFFRDAVTRSLKTTYDEAFFQSNVLFLDLNPAHAYDHAAVINDVFYQNGDLQIEYAYIETDCVYPEGSVYDEYIQIAQVSLPKGQYHDNNVVWSVRDTEEISGMYYSESLMTLSELCGEEIVIPDAFFNWEEGEGVCITTFQELTEFLSNFMTEAGIVFFQEQYPEKFFETKVLYLYPEVEFYGTEKYSCDIIKSKGIITVDVRQTDGGGCEMGDYLGQLTLDKQSAENADISFRIFTPEDGLDRGDLLYYEMPNECGTDLWNCPSALAVHQYSFLEESNVDFYWCYPTGIDLYGEVAVLECVETESRFSPFDEVYDRTVDSDGNIIYTGENYEILFKTDSVEVRIRTSGNTDAYEVFEFSYAYSDNMNS